MTPKGSKKIEIEKSHRAPLLSFNQAEYAGLLGRSWDSNDGRMKRE